MIRISKYHAFKYFRKENIDLAFKFELFCFLVIELTLSGVKFDRKRQTIAKKRERKTEKDLCILLKEVTLWPKEWMQASPVIKHWFYYWLTFIEELLHKQLLFIPLFLWKTGLMHGIFLIYPPWSILLYEIERNSFHWNGYKRYNLFKGITFKIRIGKKYVLSLLWGKNNTLEQLTAADSKIIAGMNKRFPLPKFFKVYWKSVSTLWVWRNCIFPTFWFAIISRASVSCVFLA